MCWVGASFQSELQLQHPGSAGCHGALTSAHPAARRLQAWELRAAPRPRCCCRRRAMGPYNSPIPPLPACWAFFGPTDLAAARSVTNFHLQSFSEVYRAPSQVLPPLSGQSRPPCGCQNIAYSSLITVLLQCHESPAQVRHIRRWSRPSSCLPVCQPSPRPCRPPRPRPRAPWCCRRAPARGAWPLTGYPAPLRCIGAADGAATPRISRHKPCMPPARYLGLPHP